MKHSNTSNLQIKIDRISTNFNNPAHTSVKIYMNKFNSHSVQCALHKQKIYQRLRQTVIAKTVAENNGNCCMCSSAKENKINATDKTK